MTKTFRLIPDFPVGMGQLNFVLGRPRLKVDGHRRNVTCPNPSSPRARFQRFGIDAGRELRRRRQMFRTLIQLRKIRRQLLSGSIPKKRRDPDWREWTRVAVLLRMFESLTCIVKLRFADRKFESSDGNRFQVLKRTITQTDQSSL